MSLIAQDIKTHCLTSEFVGIPSSGLNSKHVGKVGAGDHHCSKERQRPSGRSLAFTEFIQIILKLTNLWVQYKISAGGRSDRDIRKKYEVERG